MKTETRETLRRIRKNRVVRIVAVGTVGFFVIYKMGEMRGFKMVKPFHFEGIDDQLVKDIFGNIYKIQMDKM